jgi:hypothetical protein
VKDLARDILGPPPWTDEKLTEAYSADFIGIFRAIHIHAGYRPHAELETLALSMRLFDRAVESLKEAVEAFRLHSQERGFRTRASGDMTEQTILAVQSALFQVATTAGAYQARAKTLSGRITVPDFKKRVDATFTNSERHLFVQDLRNHLSHVAPLEAEWELSRPGRHSPQIARFLLFVDDLTDAATGGRKGWDKAALRFIEKHRRSQHNQGGEIDVVTLFDDYAEQLHDFHTWLVPAAEAAAGVPLNDYRDSERRVYRIATRIGWKALIIPSLTHNPRAVLDARLTPSEIALLNTMPSGSPEQVNQLITFIDNAEYEFVDSDIRAAIFQAFGLSAG